MKILVSWLNDYIDVGGDAGQIAETLSDLGLPCEGIEPLDGDAVIDVEVTSNRGDCLSYIGIARELSAATGKELKIPDVRLDELDKVADQFVSVQIDDPQLCGRYTARVIEGVKVGPSPEWMKKRLETLGMRSVNNVVDATNYAMLETGQPPHAFDMATIGQGRIIVRKARPGERIVSIDGTQCDLKEDMLVIADATRPVGVAGVMGGLDTEVGDATTTILLEDAYFDPVSIRTTSRALNLPSEAAFRFERIVDVERVDWASARTAQLIAQVAGGKVAKGLVDVYPNRRKPTHVTLRLSRLRHLLGIDVPQADVLRILSALCFEPKLDGDNVRCIAPSWRNDIYREVDLIEEVIRVYGYGRIPTRRRIEIEAVPADARQRMVEQIASSLTGCGFFETVTITFVDDRTGSLFAAGQAPEHLKVRDVSRKSANLLRRSLLGSLLAVLKTNVNVKRLPCRLYEIADTFVPTGTAGELPEQTGKLALVCDADPRVLRGAIETLIRSIDRDAKVEFTPTDVPWALVGGQVRVNGALIGSAGMFSKAVCDHFDFKEIEPCGAELDFESLMALRKGPIKVKPIARFPAVVRDLSVIVQEAISWAQIEATVVESAPAELERLSFVGIYRGKGIPPGSKSVTLSLRFRDEDGTLTHETVDRFQDRIVDSLARAVGAQLRTV